MEREAQQKQTSSFEEEKTLSRQEVSSPPSSPLPVKAITDPEQRTDSFKMSQPEIQEELPSAHSSFPTHSQQGLSTSPSGPKERPPTLPPHPLLQAARRTSVTRDFLVDFLSMVVESLKHVYLHQQPREEDAFLFFRMPAQDDTYILTDVKPAAKTDSKIKQIFSQMEERIRGKRRQRDKRLMADDADDESSGGEHSSSAASSCSPLGHASSQDKVADSSVESVPDVAKKPSAKTITIDGRDDKFELVYRLSLSFENRNIKRFCTKLESSTMEEDSSSSDVDSPSTSLVERGLSPLMSDSTLPSVVEAFRKEVELGENSREPGNGKSANDDEMDVVEVEEESRSSSVLSSATFTDARLESRSVPHSLISSSSRHGSESDSS